MSIMPAIPIASVTQCRQWSWPTRTLRCLTVHLPLESCQRVSPSILQLKTGLKGSPGLAVSCTTSPGHLQRLWGTPRRLRWGDQQLGQLWRDSHPAPGRRLQRSRGALQTSCTAPCASLRMMSRTHRSNPDLMGLVLKDTAVHAGDAMQASHSSHRRIAG